MTLAITLLLDIIYCPRDGTSKKIICNRHTIQSKFTASDFFFTNVGSLDIAIFHIPIARLVLSNTWNNEQYLWHKTGYCPKLFPFSPVSQSNVGWVLEAHYESLFPLFSLCCTFILSLSLYNILMLAQSNCTTTIYHQVALISDSWNSYWGQWEAYQNYFERYCLQIMKICWEVTHWSIPNVYQNECSISKKCWQRQNCWEFVLWYFEHFSQFNIWANFSCIFVFFAVF